ncbi:hypothetical protein [Sulfitobacter sp. R18_1]|uniref:hypothetical protein n=1 Tax=Sulfitobacter sp. R18_1 TaxID=2821104 RepID=UPI001ADC3E15|nr:hypothetical protein [Sulfitobacter sp. R18_1]MBO9428191.1 hypothetical protein [Sulfitobacter sp. R18_1]
MKVYFPAAILDREDLHPRDAETCRSVFVSRYPKRAITEDEVNDHDQVIEIDVPDIRLSAINDLAPNKYDQMEPILRQRAVRSHIATMTDDEIYEVLDEAGIEYEIPAMAPGF